MNPQRRNVERMAHVLGVHQQADFTVNRNRHFGGYDVVFGILVVGSIETIEVRVGLTDLVWVNRAELSIGARIAEIERKLPGLNLNGQGVGAGRGEVDGSPGFYSENSQSENLHAHKNKRGRY